MSHSGSPYSWRGEDWNKPGMASFNIDAEMARRQTEVVEWLNSSLSDLNIAPNAPEEELRARLIDGTVFLGILKRFIPANADENKISSPSCESRLENIRRFCAAVEQMGLPSFKVSELEQGPISAIVYCLWSLKDHLSSDLGGDKSTGSPVTSARRAWKAMEKSPLESSEMLQEGNQIGQSSPVLGAKARAAVLSEPRLQQLLFRGSIMSEPTTPQSHQGGNKFHEVFQLRQGRYRDLPAAKLSEMMKSNSIDNAPTQSLLSVVNGILEESIERKNGEIPNRVACLLKKVLQEIERRISTQAEHIRNQNNLIKAREEKYQSRIKVLETLATGPSENSQIVTSQLQMLKTERSKIEEMKVEQADVAKLVKENESSTRLISELKRDLEKTKKSYENRFEQVKVESGKPQTDLEQQMREREQQFMKENEASSRLISELKRELENMKRSYENRFDQVKVEAGKPQTDLEQQLGETEQQLRKREQQLMKENETSSRLISELKRDLENLKRLYENQFDQVKVEAGKPQTELEQQLRNTEQQLMEREQQMIKENETSTRLISELKSDLEKMRRLCENRFDQVKVESGKPQIELEQQLKDTEQQLKETKQQLKEIEQQLMKEKETSTRLILELKSDLEKMKRLYDNRFDQVKMEAGKPQIELEQQLKDTKQQLREREQQLMKEKENSTQLISELKSDLEKMKRLYDNRFDQVKVESGKPQIELEQQLMKIEKQLKETEQRLQEREQQMIKEKETSTQLISELKSDLEKMKRLYDNRFDQVKVESRKPQIELEQQLMKIEKQLKETEQQLQKREQQLIKEKETSTRLISEPKSDLENMKNLYETRFDQVKVVAGKSQIELEQQLKETEQQLREREQKLMKEKEISTRLISELKSDLENVKKIYDDRFDQVKVEAGKPQILLEQQLRETKQQLREREEQLMKENENSAQLISKLKFDLESMKKSYENQFEQVKLEAVKPQIELEQQLRETEQQLREREQYMMKENEASIRLISELKLDLENMKISYDNQFEQVKLEAEKPGIELEKQLRKTEQQLKEKEQQLKETEQQLRETKQQLRETEQLLNEKEAVLEQTRKMIKDLETASESKLKIWNKKLYIVDNFIRLQLQSLEELRSSSDTIKREVVDTRTNWSKEVASLGQKLKVLTDIAKTYQKVLAENRRLYNEVQELKGNIRVYCRVRPFLPGENRKQSTVECIGENGEIVVANPSKPSREGQKAFAFNKVFGQTATQEDVYLDTQPLVRSVLDGYNVCIFAYGQTGAGKTYTMTGPNSATEKEWGVNYRALNDLFEISRNRKDTFAYEVAVQMVEIYNEQVRDLLAHDGGAPKKLGVLNTSQPNGLAVPDACMQTVTATSDVLDLMHIGLNNRAMSSTALNERSSRSHSILTVHVRGSDVNAGTTFRGSLHLVDLAGSERVDRSEVTGDRLKEAQHINKSLSALGDVIFALSQKNSHVPYRNSKLTQVLQSSLGGHAKTLMFVQINPDVGSYSETVSTLKFAERVAGVELGAAKSQKEGKDIRDLMEQVASLKDTIAMKDEEIEQLQLQKESRSRPSIIKSERHTVHDNKELIGQQRIDGGEADVEISDLGDADSDRLSDVSGTEGSLGSAAELNILPEQGKPSQIVKERRPRVPTQLSRTSSATKSESVTASRSRLKESLARSTSTKKPGTSQVKEPSSPRTISRR